MRFEVGKWYKYRIDEEEVWVLKYSHENSNTSSGITEVWGYQICLNDGWYNKAAWSDFDAMYDIELFTDLSEIQQYLPEDHVDKLGYYKIDSKDVFPLSTNDLIVGDCYVAIFKTPYTFLLKYKGNLEGIYIDLTNKLYHSSGCFKDAKFRPATYSEIGLIEESIQNGGYTEPLEAKERDLALLLGKEYSQQSNNNNLNLKQENGKNNKEPIRKVPRQNLSVEGGARQAECIILKRGSRIVSV